MGEVAGFERPNWYAFAGENRYRHTYGKPNWFEACQRECEFVQNSVALFDQSSYPVFKVVGPQAMDFLNYLSANQVDVGVGEIVYTQYIYLFQAAGMVLLVAMIGAISLTMRKRPGVRRQVIADQNARSRAQSVEVVEVPVGAAARTVHTVQPSKREG